SRATHTDAAKLYLGWFKDHRKSYSNTEGTINAHILPSLGSKVIEKTTRKDYKHWMRQLAKAPARQRARRGEAQAFRAAPDTDDAVRARRATVNRILTVLKAMLNHAVEEELVAKPGPWREIKPFEKTDEPIIRFLTEDECKTLIDACSVEF